MGDKVSKEIRSKTMKAIRSKNTRLEQLITNKLWSLGYRFRKNVKSLFGTPDIAIKKYKEVIFIDSCFWHGCPYHCRLPKSNEEFWVTKIRKNQERDTIVTNYYRDKGWTFLRFWEHQITDDFSKVIEEITDTFKAARNKIKGQ
ncbi:very short patch repair endonuclease [Brevibacillus agri]|uniref:very short patch repair endonuclease n=1 Tax=Brevibacillus agri TaxID=51101 RepID=UPI002E1BBF6C|nr:very short patch repair endonuclease [Brevibacillus agri]